MPVSAPREEVIGLEGQRLLGISGERTRLRGDDHGVGVGETFATSSTSTVPGRSDSTVIPEAKVWTLGVN